MTTVFKMSLLVAGVASLLLTTGCAATSVRAAEAPAAPASASAKAAPTHTAETSAAAQYTMPYEFDALAYVDPMGTKAGESMRVTGGTMKPGAIATVYVAQLMAMPSQDSTGMYHQVGEQVKLTAPVVVTVDEKGQYDIQIPIPAGTAPQQVDVISELTGVAPGDPSGGLSRSSIK
ncbi:hypothetical protein [Pseudarthrobacter sp. Y6]|uniref:hypothetical protein n=1 Tax=Pseudarthrobacter sp. Y6 TaxID=3418422 RepID=UPI003CF3A45A